MRMPHARRTGREALDLFLPRVLHQEGDGWRELDYDTDILPEVAWG